MASGMVESSSQSQTAEQQQRSGQGQAISRSKLVQRLLATSANLPAFLNDLLTTQAITVAGTEAAAFLIERGEEDGQAVPVLKAVAHIRPGDNDEAARAAALNAFQDIIKPCIAANRDDAFEVGPANDSYEAQYCLVTLLRADGEIVAASAVITRCRDIARAQQRLQSMQLVAGYFDLYTLRRTSEQSRQIAQSHQHVLQLATAVGTANGFKASSMNLCNELAARTGATRVSIGWLKGTRIKVKALSHTEDFDKKQELIVQLERAMEESLDQEEVVQYEPGEDGTTTQNVTREAAALSRAQGGNTIISLPLRRGGHHGHDSEDGTSEIIGVITLEFTAGTKLAPQAATGLAVAADLLAPQLYDRFQNDRWLITKTGISIRETAKLAIGPKHMLAKTIIALVIAAGIFLCVYSPMYKVAGNFKFVPIEHRLISAPYDGFISEVHVKPGALVQANDKLVTLKTTELEQQLNEAEANAHSFDKERLRLEEEMNEQGFRRTAEAAEAAAKRDAALAQAELFRFRIENAVIRAPFAGVVLQGDLQSKIAAPVKLGDALIELGKPDKLKVEIKVADRDIQDVKIGQAGTLATLAYPSRKFPITIDNIVPKANAVEGDNRFIVFATLDANNRSDQWLPGETGETRINVRPEPLIWQWTHRLTEWARLKLWI